MENCKRGNGRYLMMMQSSFQLMRRAYAAAVRLAKRLISFRDEDRPIWQRWTKNFSIGLWGSLALIVIGLGRTVLLTKSLVIADYGKILIVINLFSFLGAFLSVRVSDVIYRFYPQFEQERDTDALRGLLFLCLALSMAVGLTLGVGVFMLAPWIADRFYQDASIASLLRIFASTALISAFGGVYTSILRLHNRFLAIVIPQVVGGAITLAVLGVYFYTADVYRLEPVMVALVLGVLVQTVPPLVQVLPILRSYLFTTQAGPLFRALRRHRHELVSTLVQTNLVGYLKLVFSPGDIFLLGIFSTPTQVALYGLARQLTSPLLTLQNNIQTAIMPEVVSLWAKRKLKQLNRLVHCYITSAFVVAALALFLLVFLAHPIIEGISKPEYLKALPVFYVQVLIVCMMAVTLIFYPIGLTMGMLKLYNISQLLNLGLFLFVLMMFGLDALKMAFIQLGAMLIMCTVFYGPVYHRLRLKNGDQNEGI